MSTLHDVQGANPDAQDTPTLSRLENLLNDDLDVKSDDEWAAEETAAKKKAGEQDLESEEAAEDDNEVVKSETADEDDAGDDASGKEGESEDESEDDAEQESEVDDGKTEAEDAEEASQALLRDLAGDKDYSDFLENTLVEVKVDGETSRVPLSKAIKSYQLEGHLNRKLQEAADVRKAFDAERGDKEKHIADQANELEAALQISAAMLQGEFASVDWAKLQQENPQEFLIKKSNFDQRKGTLVDLYDRLQKGREEATAKAQKEQQEKFGTFVKEQNEKLLNHLPAWADEGTAKKEMQALKDYLTQEHGFTEADGRPLFDHRWVIIARDAMRYRDAQKKANAQAKKIRKAPKMSKPGPSKRTDAKGDKVRQERARLRKTGKFSPELMDAMGLLD